MLLKIYIYRTFNYIKKNGFKKAFYKIKEKFENRKIINNLYSTFRQEEEVYIHTFPFISIVVPIYNTQKQHLIEMIESVLKQTYPNFELCLYNAGSTNDEISKILSRYETKDPRIIVQTNNQNEGIAINTNKVIYMSSGEYIAFLDHDDLLHEDALYEVVKEINKADPDIIYTDEDKITHDGKKHLEPNRKPEWSPDTLQSHNYICHFMVVRKCLILSVGGLIAEYDGSQDYDLILRLTDLTKKIAHIPKILYHWRISSSSTALDISRKDYAIEAGRKSIENFLIKKGYPIKMKRSEYLGAYIQDYSKSLSPDKLQFIIYGDRSEKDDILEYLKSLYIPLNKALIIFISKKLDHNYSISDSIQVMGILNNNFTKVFNYILENIILSRYFIFLYDSISVLRPDWYTILYNAGLQEHISVVSSKILSYDKKTIQSYGLVINKKGLYDINKKKNINYFGYMGRMKVAHNVTAVSPEAILLKSDDVKISGGLDEAYHSPLAIIDYCIKLSQRYRFVKVIPLELFFTINENWIEEKDLDLLIEKNKNILSSFDKYTPNYIN